jgi:hypothetical protein
MSHTRDQVNILLKRADELRARGLHTERKLFEMLEEIARFSARSSAKGGDPVHQIPPVWNSVLARRGTLDPHG